MRLKIGSKFRWLGIKHHVLGFVQDGDEQLIVAKYWRGSKWGFEVIPNFLYEEHLAQKKQRRCNLIES